MATQAVKDILDITPPKPSWVWSPSASGPGSTTNPKNDFRIFRGGEHIGINPTSGKWRRYASDEFALYGDSVGVLKQPSRTQYFHQNGKLDNPRWEFRDVSYNGSVSSPADFRNGALIYVPSSTADHVLRYQASNTGEGLGAGKWGTLSLYARPFSLDWVFFKVRVGDADGTSTQNFLVWFNIATDTVGTVENPDKVKNIDAYFDARIAGYSRPCVSVQPVSGWEVEVSADIGFSDADDNPVYASSGENAAVVFGAELQNTRTAQPPVITESNSTKSINRETIRTDGTPVGDWWNTEEGSFVVAFEYPNAVLATAEPLIDFQGGGGAFGKDGGRQQEPFTIAMSDNGPYGDHLRINNTVGNEITTAAVTWGGRDNRQALSVNGEVAQKNYAGGWKPKPDKIEVARRDKESVVIYSVRYIPRYIKPTNLQAITA